MKSICIKYFSPQPAFSEIPIELFDPFGYEFHQLAIRAGECLKSKLHQAPKIAINDSFSKDGRMYGVLVVKEKKTETEGVERIEGTQSNEKIGFLSAYSGEMPQQATNKISGLNFVPSTFSDYQHTSELIDYSKRILTNSLGQTKSIEELWGSDYSPESVGSCAAIKLFQFANLNGLQPLAFAEFWWDDVLPSKGNVSDKLSEMSFDKPFDILVSKGVRHHGQFYPACRGKCGPVLPFMLQGLKVKSRDLLGVFTQDDNAPEVIYEDDDLVVVNKPAGLLSVPGKEVNDSVESRLQMRYPDTTGPLLLHRLDLATSGLLLAAKNKTTHKLLQKQFMQRTIEKRYIALLAKTLSEEKGSVDLPLRTDFDDRPRQLVCFERGKSAITHWELIENKENHARVYLYPVTGRTHQLRIHMAHKYGLNAPIIGDRLYAAYDQNNQAERLMLHAQRLIFTHPVSGKQISCEAPVPF